MHGLRSTVLQVQPVLLRLLLSAWVQRSPVGKQTGWIAYAANPCELEGCPASKPGYINVHVLSHSHMDAGWLQTVDVIYETYATTIYDNTTLALLQKSSRRFVSSENVFFARWWRQKPTQVKEKFVGGGWTQNDEAVTHYTATIDQMTLGLRFLNSTFGPQCGVPSVAWQADPFGHSVAQAALFTRMGFGSVMLGRISFDTKNDWQQNRSMEFVWEADSREQGGDDGHILAWVPENTYTTPQALCFSWNDCGHPGASLRSDRVTASALIEYARYQTDVYTNDTVAVMSGCDLCFADADERFPKQDAVLAKANRISAAQRKRPRVHVVHSTPACYVEACKQLSLHGGEDAAAQVTQLGEAVATLQHHDGITGTSTDVVASDYARILYQGIQKCEFSVLVYNPASVPVTHYVRLPIGGTDEPTLSVAGPAGAKVRSQVVELAPHRYGIPEVLGKATSSLVFQATVEPLGAGLYRVKREPPTSQVVTDFLELDESANFIENEVVYQVI
ncbi:hypothetical protein HPB50_017464 [Hyalomma asiaticum]|uniref:Uncharacterized protein n=1 Tax=Hyalomma asiaticum TaxID=266040 RepID=A0ACB7RKF1_HYAAI|nr:hypothetical protein HPB50_017464 [Hyalomma asiaticum]